MSKSKMDKRCFGKWILTLWFIFHAPVSGVPFHGNEVLQERPKYDINYRLPTNIIPENYRIKLIPNLKDDFIFEGEVKIHVRVLQKTNNIVLHATNIKIMKSSVSVMRITSGTSIQPVKQKYNSINDFYTITLEQKLQKNEKYDIYLKYKGHHHNDSFGFFRSSYQNSKGENVWLVATEFQPVYARRAFPCFDEPALQAKFQINIARAAHLHSVSNMPLQRTEYSHELNLYWDIFEETPMPISTYLVAFAVSDFESTRNGIVNIWHQPGIGSQALYAATFSTSALRYLGNYTNMPYFLPKMDEMPVPDYSAGAMENWAFCVYRDVYLLFAEYVSTSEDRQNIATIIFHEFAHQWFGNLVGPKWWKYLWLNEGFASYFQYLGTAALEPQWRLDEQFAVQMLQYAFLEDQSMYTHPMTVDVNTPNEIEGIFDLISYNKAGSVLRMIEHILSPPTFRRALIRYLHRMANTTAEDSDLYDDFMTQYELENPNIHLDIQSIVKSWTRQAGFPLITVNRDYDKGTVSVHQSHFLLSGPVEDNSTWWIPLTFTTKSNLNFKNPIVNGWLNGNEREKCFNLKLHRKDWIIFNIQQSGFYRVNYDSVNWCLIINYLKSKDFTNIHPVNRAQLLSDALTFARSDILSYQTVMELTSYLIQETDYIPWYAAYNTLSYLMRKLEDSKDYIPFQNYVLELLDCVYNTLGFEEKSTDDHVTKLNRNQILTLACRLGHRNCIKTATHKLDLFVKDPVKWRVEPDLQSVVYCYGLMNRGEEELSFLWRYYKNSTVSTEKRLLLNALYCVGNQEVSHNGSVVNFITKTEHIISSATPYNKIKTFIEKKVGKTGTSLLQPEKDITEWQEKYGTIIFNWLQERNILNTSEKCSQNVIY